MGVNEQQSAEALGWYEQGLIELLEQIDAALQASDQAGEALVGREATEHFQAMRKLVIILAQAHESMIKTGQRVGLLLHPALDHKDQLDSFAAHAGQTSRSMEQTLEALNIINQASDVKTALVKYISALAEFVGNVSLEHILLKKLAEVPKGFLTLDDSFNKARKLRTPVWIASENAVKQFHGDSALVMARQVAAAVYCESLEHPNDTELKVQAQAIAIKSNEVALKQMLESLSNSACAYKKAYSLA